MTLRTRLEIQQETIQEFELAATQRHREALTLRANGYGGVGVYLQGYVAEMLLKNAYFRFTGAMPSDMIQPRLGPARVRGTALIPNIPHESYHSLRFWALLLREERRARHRPLASVLDGPFVSRTRRLYLNWSVRMRHQHDQAQALEVASVYDDTLWLRDHYVALWR